MTVIKSTDYPTADREGDDEEPKLPTLPDGTKEASLEQGNPIIPPAEQETR